MLMFNKSNILGVVMYSLSVHIDMVGTTAQEIVINITTLFSWDLPQAEDNITLQGALGPSAGGLGV